MPVSLDRIPDVGAKQKRTPRIKDAKQAARKLGADEDSDALDRVVKHMAKAEADGQQEMKY